VGVARKFRDSKVIGASTPGFLGNTFKGYDAVLNAIITDVIEITKEKEEKTVNILGVVPGHDVFYRGNLDEIKRLLGLIGVKANTFFGTGESVDAIKGYAKASLNVVLSTQAGVSPAKTFEDVHQIPYILEDTPIGPTGTEKFIRRIGELLQVEAELIEAVIEKEKKIYYSFLERIVDIYSDIDFQRYAIVVADSYYAFSLTRFLANDLGWIPHLVSINDIEDAKEQALYHEKFDTITSEAKPNVFFRQNAGDVIKDIRDSWAYNHNEKYYDALAPAFVVGTGIERSMAEKLGAGFLAIAFPVSNRVVLNKGYTGFQGGLSLIEDLISSLVSAR
jgi:nitrogenase molybdenum-iron protein beta chain